MTSFHVIVGMIPVCQTRARQNSTGYHHQGRRPRVPSKSENRNFSSKSLPTVAPPDRSMRSLRFEGLCLGSHGSKKKAISKTDSDSFRLGSKKSPFAWNQAPSRPGWPDHARGRPWPPAAAIFFRHSFTFCFPF